MITHMIMRTSQPQRNKMIAYRKAVTDGLSTFGIEISSISGVHGNCALANL